MRSYNAYQQAAPNWTRMDMLIAAFDGTISRLEKAATILKTDSESTQAQLLLLRSQRLVCELYAGLNLSYGEIPKNMKQIYLFVLNSIGLGEKLQIEGAVQVLRIIREALGAIRVEANELEKQNLWGGVDRDVNTIIAAVG